MTYPYRPDHTDPAVTAHHSNTAAFLTQIDTRPRSYEQPPIGPCYCGHNIQDHDSTNPEWDLCGLCECGAYVEKAGVLAARDLLDADDQFNEGRRRDNTDAAIQLARRTRP